MFVISSSVHIQFLLGNLNLILAFLVTSMEIYFK
jgi:hypothetical protein